MDRDVDIGRGEDTDTTSGVEAHDRVGGGSLARPVVHDRGQRTRLVAQPCGEKPRSIGPGGGEIECRRRVGGYDTGQVHPPAVASAEPLGACRARSESAELAAEQRVEQLRDVQCRAGRAVPPVDAGPSARSPLERFEGAAAW
jgi:hypothetical protein